MYPRLYENKLKVTGNSNIRTAIIKELLDIKVAGENKYLPSDRTGSVKPGSDVETSPEILAEDITKILAEDNKTDKRWDYTDPIVKFARSGSGENEGLSGTYPTIFININGGIQKFVLRAPSADTTSTVFKESMVNFFFKSKKTYVEFDKSSGTKLSNYIKMIDEILIEISEDGIPGCYPADINEVSTFLENAKSNYTLLVINSLFNSLSVGNYLKKSVFKDWEVYRDKTFDDIKNGIARDLYGFSNPDKWNPMDIILIKKGENDSIMSILEEAKKEDTSGPISKQSAMINSMFVSDIIKPEPHEIILGVSLKQAKAQSGKMKSHLDTLYPTKELKSEYNITLDEKKLYAKSINQEEGHEVATQEIKNKIIEFREQIRINCNKEDSNFEYIINGPVDNFTGTGVNELAIYHKYTSLKLLNLLVSDDIGDKNLLFTNMTNFGLGLVKNPTYFKILGNDSGDSNKVPTSISVYLAQGQVSLYNKNDKNNQGMIQIIDSNKNAGLDLLYYVKRENIIERIPVKIRVNAGGYPGQATIEMGIIKKILESFQLFYPYLFKHI